MQKQKIISAHARGMKSASPAVSSLVRLWLLRILVPLEFHRQYLSRNGIKFESLAREVGMEQWIVDPACEFDLHAARGVLRNEYERAERSRCRAVVPKALRANVDRLSKLVGLSAIDCRVLEFAVLIHSEQLLDDTADGLGLLTTAKAIHAIAVILALPKPGVQAALRPDGLLARSGLVTLDTSGAFKLCSKINLLSDKFADRILLTNGDPIELLRDTVIPTPAASLELRDYEHIGRQLSLLVPYLEQALASGRKGVNIFIHGEPGTGKSQLARVLAQHAGCELFQVASEDSDGDPVSAQSRLRAYRAAQSFLGNRGALIAFDEVEDVFNDNDPAGGRRSTAQTRKAWINRALEENPVPTLWLTNAAQGLDPAFIRRFDMVIAVPVPPRAQRVRIVQRACGDMLAPEMVERIADAATMAPAIIARAASVIGSIRNQLAPEAVSDAVVQLVSATLEAQGHAKLVCAGPGAASSAYDPRYVASATNLETLVAGIEKRRFGRICLYGPPGTGKTAFGRWLAKRLDMPLQMVRASDLLSKYLGATEANMARVFRDAKQNGALLLIDEVDSFLQDRGGKRASWEITAVNEMLTQIECFTGVLVASTNLMDGLDQAALRRFDIKLEFSYMGADQAWHLFSKKTAELGLVPHAGASKTGLQPLLASVRNLTPGDFEAVARRHLLQPFASQGEFLAALKADIALKEDARSSKIGFV